VVGEVSLSNQDDFVAVFAPKFKDTLFSDRLGNRGRVRVLKEIRAAISQTDPARPPHKRTKPVESTEHLEKLYATDRIRIWCRAVRGIAGYEVLFVLEIDPAHRYSNSQLTDLDDDVEETLESIGTVEDDPESFLDDYNLLDESDVAEMIERFE
jgi:hypothetical protein